MKYARICICCVLTLFITPSAGLAEKFNSYALFIAVENAPRKDAPLNLKKKLIQMEKDLAGCFDKVDLMYEDHPSGTSRPDRARIIHRLNQLMREDIDTFFLYYGSHGKPAGEKDVFLTTGSTEFDDEAGVTFLRFSELRPLIEKVGNQRVAVIEACNFPNSHQNGSLFRQDAVLSTPGQEFYDTFFFYPKEAIHQSDFLDKLKTMVSDDPGQHDFYPLRSFYGKLNLTPDNRKQEIWLSDPSLKDKTVEDSVCQGFYVIDKRPYISVEITGWEALTNIQDNLSIAISHENGEEYTITRARPISPSIPLVKKSVAETVRLKFIPKISRDIKPIDRPMSYRGCLDKPAQKFVQVEKGHFTYTTSIDNIFSSCLSRRRALHPPAIESQLLEGRFIRVESDENIHPPFYLQSSEVSQRQWRRVVKKGTPPWEGDCLDETMRKNDYPVVCVSWRDVNDFIGKLNKRDTRYAYRLPTEKEWELACKAGAETRFAWGDEPDCAKANFGKGLRLGECAGKDPGPIWRVGDRRSEAWKNAWGFYDMHGNVWEWCGDRSGLDEEDMMVTRGGAWHNQSETCASESRGSLPRSARRSDQGFRLVIEEKKALPDNLATNAKRSN